MTANQSGRRFFFLLLAAGAVLMALVIRPLAVPLFLATVFAVVLWPIHLALAVRLGNRPTVAAGAVVLGMVLLLVTPLVGFSAFIVNEGSEGLKVISNLARSESVTGFVKKLPGPLESLATEMLSHVPEPKESGGVDTQEPQTTDGKEPAVDGEDAKVEDVAAEKAAQDASDKKVKDAEVDARLVEQLKSGGGKAVAAVGYAASATGSLLFQATMMLIALFFLLLHGNELVSWLDGLLPLPHGQTRELLTEFRTTSYAVVVSTVVTAGVQALAALAGYLIAQVPHPLFFASVTFFVAFIPAIGAASVCLVAALILFTTGHPYMALFLVIWGLAVVGLVDNLVKPMLIKSGMKMSGAIVFFALIGGLGAFGTPGLLIGPLAVALFLALLRIYQRDFKEPASS